MFRRGTLNGFSGLIPIGGQQQPSSGVGDSLLWKNAQKNAKKNRTSDVINKIIPHRKPVVTYEVWWPIKVPSRITSRHHWTIEIMINKIDARRHQIPYPWNHLAKPTARVNAPIDDVIGQGLSSTRWNGCRIIYDFSLESFYLEGKCTNILKSYKGGVLIYKFTVYSFDRPPYNQDQIFIGLSLDCDFGILNLFCWVHQVLVVIIEVINQNIRIANNQFIGDKWGMFKIHLCDYYSLTSYCYISLTSILIKSWDSVYKWF